MFDGKYFEWNQKRVKAIIDYYTYQFFYGKKVADLGCGYADLSGSLYRLGADITAVDARENHLKIVNKKYSGIKIAKANLDGPWPFFHQKFDLILDLGLICHLMSFEEHLRAVCASTTHLVLETAVCDSSEIKVIQVPEGKDVYDLSFNGMGCRPTAAAVEKVLTECGMNFNRMDESRFNVEDYVYDWQSQNDNSTSLNKRRIWFAVKAENASNPIQITVPQGPFSPHIPIENSAVPVVLPANLAITPPSAPPPTPAFAPVPPPALVSTPTPTPAPAPAPAPVLAALAPNTVTVIHEPLKSGYKHGLKRFVIVIPSYNNVNWCEKNIISALNQNYENFRVIFTDDCSTDGTFDKVSQVVKNSGKGHRATLIKNTTRIGALGNLYNMIHSCEDDEIILTLDGDDWLAHDNVLTRLNEVYTGDKVWMTYGQYKNSNDGGTGVAQPYPHHIIESSAFRQHTWGASHLRTFYTWLFKKIKKDDLLMGNGQFYTMTWDFAIMFPMLEMAGHHSKFLSDILYVYNLENPINDHKVNVKLQQDLDRAIRGKARYGRSEMPPLRKTGVGLLLIATGKYHRFIQGMISSADRFFFADGNADVTYYVFSDTVPQVQSSRRVVHIQIPHKPFPFASMDRFKHFINNATALSPEDYLYYVDVDCLFVDKVGPEILGNLVGVQHCGYYNKQGPYELNPQSALYIDPATYKQYFGGGFSGGLRHRYLELAEWCSTMIDKDVANGIIPIWHDESAINRYFAVVAPDVVLSPAYHYPQSNVEYYKKIWAPNNWQPKILLLDKNHVEVRQ